MILHFHIHFIPETGQDLYLNIIEGEQTCTAHKMGTGGDGEWELEMRYEIREKETLEYYYSLQEEGKVIRTEWMMPREGMTPACPHNIPLTLKGLQSFTTYDNWMDEPIDAIMFSAPFTKCLNKRSLSKPYQHPNPAILRIRVYAPQLRSNERLVLCGSHPVLGDWNPERGIPCFEQSPNEWICDINTEYTANEDLEYKFVAMAKSNTLAVSQPIPPSVPIIPTTKVIAPAKADVSETPAWEIGYNRRLTAPRIKKGEVVQFCQRTAAFERSNPRMAGTVVNIHRANELNSLPSIIDWMADTHQQWLVVDTREITRSNHTKRLQEIKDYAFSRHVVMECKITSVCIPLSVWWDKDLERADKCYTETLQRRDRVPHPIPSWLARDIMMRKLLKQDTMLCLFPYQDWQLLGDIKSIRIKDNIREMLAQSQRIY